MKKAMSFQSHAEGPLLFLFVHTNTSARYRRRVFLESGYNSTFPPDLSGYNPQHCLKSVGVCIPDRPGRRSDSAPRIPAFQLLFPQRGNQRSSLCRWGKCTGRIGGAFGPDKRNRKRCSSRTEEMCDSTPRLPYCKPGTLGRSA